MKSHLPSSDVRTLLHEKLDAMLDECNLVMDNAENGHIPFVNFALIPPPRHACRNRI